MTAQRTFLEGIDVEETESISLVPLTHGQVAIVDSCDDELVKRFIWKAMRSTDGNTWYAATFGSKPDGSKGTIRLHRFLLGEPEGMVVDHRDGNGLNNRRTNIRACEVDWNKRNRRKYVSATSAFKGVCRAESAWVARIQFEGKRIYLGRFANERDAALAYDAAAVRLFGEFANLNFPAEVVA